MFALNNPITCLHHQVVLIPPKKVGTHEWYSLTNPFYREQPFLKAMQTHDTALLSCNPRYNTTFSSWTSCLSEVSYMHYTGGLLEANVDEKELSHRAKVI